MIVKHSSAEPGRFGARVRSRREELGLSLRQTAHKVGISPTYLSDVETGQETTPAERVIRALASVLNDDFDSLMHLAGRIPSDLQAYIASDPSMLGFLWWAKERQFTGAQLLSLLRESEFANRN
jgi:transcriptional regulator with XRE-family HTH domain